MVGITSVGAYVPRLRLTRRAIVDAHRWADPALAGKAAGERSMCNWDEDAITMAVEAGRRALASPAGPSPDAVYFASTTAPFADRQNAGVIAGALAMGEAGVSSLDIGASQRAGVAALIQAMGAVRGGLQREILVVAGDHRRTRAASAAELAYGDGACAMVVGEREPLLEFLGSRSTTVDFIDHFRSAGEAFDYTWEERWIRDEGLAKIVPPCVVAALEDAGIGPDAVTHFVMPSTIGRAVSGIARSVGIDPERVADNMHAVMGETGVAHPLMMTAHALERGAEPGDVVVMVGFGHGCDVLVLQVTDAWAERAQPGLQGGVLTAIADRREETNYQKFLAFNDLVTLERGMRAETENYKTALSVTYRKRDMLTGLIGGRCRQCGTAQFPRARVCVNPQCKALDTQDPYPFRDEPASVLTWSADYLTYTADPPAHYGMITFAEGGRFMTDFTDVEPGEVAVGVSVRMVFRIKSFDRVRGFVRYFWKAVPERTAGSPIQGSA